MTTEATATEGQDSELEKARETIRRLNRRCQKAEGLIAKSGIVENRPQGPEGRSLGRALANYAAAQKELENEKLREEIARLKREQKIYA